MKFVLEKENVPSRVNDYLSGVDFKIRGIENRHSSYLAILFPKWMKTCSLVKNYPTCMAKKTLRQYQSEFICISFITWQNKNIKSFLEKDNNWSNRKVNTLIKFFCFSQSSSPFTCTRTKRKRNYSSANLIVRSYTRSYDVYETHRHRN